MVRPATALRARLARTATGDAEVLLGRELPALAADRRRAAAVFVGERVAGLPSPMAVGVGLVAALVAALGGLAGKDRIVGTVASRNPPLGGDYVRLLRSLGFAFVWETWPDTAVDGSTRGASGAGAAAGTAVTAPTITDDARRRAGQR